MVEFFFSYIWPLLIMVAESVLLLTVLLIRVSVPELLIPPPLSALLALMVLLLRVSVLLL